MAYARKSFDLGSTEPFSGLRGPAPVSGGPLLVSSDGSEITASTFTVAASGGANSAPTIVAASELVRISPTTIDADEPVFTPEGHIWYQTSSGPMEWDPATGLTTASVIGDSNTRSLSFTPDGSKAVYETLSIGLRQIAVQDMSTNVVTIVSTSNAGTAGNSNSLYPAISDSGNLVAFRSSASNLVAGDTERLFDVFVKNLTTGAVTRIPGDARGIDFMPDDSGIVFSTSRSYAGVDTNGKFDIYKYDFTSGAYTLLSKNASGAAGNGNSTDPDVSPDGGFIVFDTTATNLLTDSNYKSDVYLQNLTTGSMSIVSKSAATGLFGGNSINGVFSPDGKQVAFLSDGTESLYVKNLETGVITKMSVGSALSLYDSVDAMSFSPDGLFIAFTMSNEYHSQNDAVFLAPVTVTKIAADLTEDTNLVSGFLKSDGAVVFTDSDVADTHTLTVAGSGNLGLLTASISNDSTGGTGGEITWSYSLDNSLVQFLKLGETRTETFTLQLKDGTDTTLQDVTITIHGQNDLPYRTSLPGFIPGIKTIIDKSILLEGFVDPDGDVLTVLNITANHGTVSDNGDGTITVMPVAGYQGTMTLSYKVSDGTGSVSTTRQYIPSNKIPVQNGPQAVLPTGYKDSPYIISKSVLTVGFSDPDGDALTVVNISANHGTVTDNGDGTITITPVTGYLGGMFLNFAVSDGFGGSAATTTSYVIVSANPVLSGPQPELPDGTQATPYIIQASDLLAGFTDADGDSLSVVDLAADHGTITNNGDGTFTLSPDPLYFGEVRLTYVVSDGEGGRIRADQIIELVEARTVVFSDVSFTLPDDIDNLVLTGHRNAVGIGNALDNALYGNDGNNRLDGLLGADYMAGGEGDDTYNVDNAGDQVIEQAGEGRDKVNAYVDYVLAEQVEKLELMGSAISGTGNGLNNLLIGNALDNILIGLGGDDRINGMEGADTMIGGKGNDTYYVDNAGDVVVEEMGNSATVQGWQDYVYSSVSFDSAGIYVETIELTGTANINALGNEKANTLIGNAGNNRLDGRAGNDTMIGGLGNDTYYVRDAGDVVTEQAGEGTDIVMANISHTLAANVEQLVLNGTAAINGTGNSQGNRLTGNDADNVLSGLTGSDVIFGGDGNDTIIGGRGNDTLWGQGGADKFRFEKASLNNTDIIKDFVSGEDTLVFRGADYGFAAGLNLTPSEYSLASAPSGTYAQFYFDTATHTLYFDADGSGSTAAVALAVFDNAATPAADDFVFV